jgi:hypothetical protein
MGRQTFIYVSEPPVTENAVFLVVRKEQKYCLRCQF